MGGKRTFGENRRSAFDHISVGGPEMLNQDVQQAAPARSAKGAAGAETLDGRTAQPQGL